MFLFNFFKKNGGPSVKKAAILFLPQKIIVITQNIVDDFTSVFTDNFTVLQPDTDDSLLGQTILEHIAATKKIKKGSIDVRKNYSDFIKKAGFKTMKSVNEFAQYMSIEESKEQIILTPFSNYNSAKKTQVYQRSPAFVTPLNKPVDNETLGKTTRLVQQKCDFKNS